jgi:hypothetical protein
MGTERGKARPGRDDDPSPPSTAEVKYESELPPCASMAYSGYSFKMNRTWKKGQTEKKKDVRKETRVKKEGIKTKNKLTWSPTNTDIHRRLAKIFDDEIVVEKSTVSADGWVYSINQSASWGSSYEVQATVKSVIIIENISGLHFEIWCITLTAL